MTLALLLILSVGALAYANGANDNFKGVATLYGSGTLGYRAALALATAATALGAMLAVLLAGKLAATFSGRGFVDDALLSEPAFPVSVALAASATILLATRLGMPTSTTHAITGALIGIGILDGMTAQAPGVLWNQFLLPLLLSPVVAAGLAYLAMRLYGRRPQAATLPAACLCIQPEPAPVALAAARRGLRPMPLAGNGMRGLAFGRIGDPGCDSAAAVLRAPEGPLVERIHILSGVAVCFARAVNDTPKIAALWLGAAASGASLFLATGVAMTAGGLLGARRVAETMSRRISAIDPGEGARGNLVTAVIVLAASPLGLPVATTHVSCGSIIGIGLRNGRADFLVIRHVLLAWLLTLPLGLFLGMAAFVLLR